MPSPCLKGTTSTRLCIRGPLFGEHKLAAREIPARLRKQDRDLKGKGDFAIEVLMQAIEITRAILQQEGRGPRLTRVVALPQEIRMSRRISFRHRGFGAHALRATALDHQADIAKVQEWLGHANIATTRIYDYSRTRPEDSPTFEVAY